MYKSTKWVEMGTWWSRCTLFDREIGYLIKSGGRGGSRFLFSENKKEKPAASGRHDMVSGRIQYPAHRRHFLPGLSDSHKHPDILRDLRSLLVSGFWKTRQETYRTNYPLWRRDAVFSKVLWWQVLLHHGLYDDFRNRPAHFTSMSSHLHRGLLFWPWSSPASGRNCIYL